MRRSATVRGAFVVAGIGLVWCGLLPAVQRVALVERHVAAMEGRDVNPAAMVYTELDRLPLRPAWIEGRIVLWP
jgi:hypothetical protein